MKQHRRLSAATVAAANAIALALSAFNAAADDLALRRCRTLPEAAARLACYDALPVAAATPAAPSLPLAVPAAMPPVLRATLPPASAPAPASAPPPATAAAAASRPQPSRFGLEAPRPEPSAINSRIEGTFEGWGPRTRFKLDNGQIWEVTDGSSGAYHLQSPQVTVRRAAFGSFLLEIEGANQAPRVRRVE